MYAGLMEISTFLVIYTYYISELVCEKFKNNLSIYGVQMSYFSTSYLNPNFDGLYNVVKHKIKFNLYKRL
jgi:hypothetical protein